MELLPQHGRWSKPHPPPAAATPVQVNAGFLAVHFGVVVLLPVVASYCWDSNHRKRLQARDAHGKAG